MRAALQADCRRLGIDAARLLPAPGGQEQQSAHFELWPEHARAWRVFMACQSQWRRTAGLERVSLDGLDYRGVEVVMRRQGVPAAEADKVFAQVQVLENEMLRICNARPQG